MLQHSVAVCCNTVLQCVAIQCCSVLQHSVAVCCNTVLQCVATQCCSALQHSVAVCCNTVLQCVATQNPDDHPGILSGILNNRHHHVAVCFGVLQCVAVCCNTMTVLDSDCNSDDPFKSPFFGDGLYCAPQKSARIQFVVFRWLVFAVIYWLVEFMTCVRDIIMTRGVRDLGSWFSDGLCLWCYNGS